MVVKKTQGPPFTVFGIVRNFKMNYFCLQIRFFEAQHAISEFCFFSAFFACYFFSKFFSSKPPSIFTVNETFCKHKGLLKVFGIMRLTGDLLQKNFRKVSIFFSLFFCFFFNVPSCERWVFLLFPVGEEWFSRFMRIPSGYFWRSKIDEILTMSIYTWFSA